MSTNIVTGSVPTDYEAAPSHTITVRETLAGMPNSPRDTVLTINVSDVDDTDTTPNAFSFSPQTGAALSTPITSAPITVSGITAPSPLTVTGGQYSINGGALASTPTTVVNGNTVTLTVTSSGSNSTATSATLTIGGVSGTFTVTTLAAGAWAPTDLGSALIAAYTALRAGTVHTASGNITSWDDFSGNSRTLTSAASHEPAFSATGFSGGPGLTFDPANDERMASVAEAINFGTGAAFAVFMSIILRNTTESFGRILGFKGFVESDDAAGTSFTVLRNGTNDQFDLYNGGTVCSFVPTYDTPLRLAVVADGANARFYINNVAQSSAAFSQAIGPTGTLHVGAYSFTGANNLGGDLRALGMMNRNPTAGELTQWDTWLQNPV